MFEPSHARPRPATRPAADLLIVENDARIVELLRWFLERRGHQVRTAASFAAACELMRERRPDLLLSDLDLGEENARDHLPELARLGALPPTLVVSGFLDSELARELLAIPGVVGVMAKPFEFERLERWIEEFCARTACAATARDATGP